MWNTKFTIGTHFKFTFAWHNELCSLCCVSMTFYFWKLDICRVSLPLWSPNCIFFNSAQDTDLAFGLPIHSASMVVSYGPFLSETLCCFPSVAPGLLCCARTQPMPCGEKMGFAVGAPPAPINYPNLWPLLFPLKCHSAYHPLTSHRRSNR